MRRTSLLRQMLTALLGALLCAALPAAAQPQRTIAIGDLHGDYEAYLEIVEAAGLADRKGHWLGGETVLVQLGDVPDRGPDSLKIIRHLAQLEAASAEAGGRVVVLVGNHEAMNVTGDLRYVHPGEYEAFRTSGSKTLRERLFERNREAILAFYRRSDPEISVRDAKRKWFEENPLGKFEHRAAWAPGGEVGAWVTGHPAIAKIGETLFVHGGISIEFSSRPIAEINAEVAGELAKGESYAESILTDPLGPLWYRGNILRAEEAASPAEGEAPAPPRPSISDELTQVLAAYDAKRLVVAHTPNRQGILVREGGRLVGVDTGISAYYGGAHCYLEILGDTAISHCAGQDGEWESEVLPQP